MWFDVCFLICLVGLGFRYVNYLRGCARALVYRCTLMCTGVGIGFYVMT